MAIRNVGNDQFTVCDFQNDLKGAEKQPVENSTPAAEAAGVGSPVSPNAQLEKSLRARNTLSSQSVKSALTSRLEGRANRSRIGREYQPAMANMVRSARRLNENTAKYRAHTEAQLNSIKG